MQEIKTSSGAFPAGDFAAACQQAVVHGQAGLQRGRRPQPGLSWRDCRGDLIASPSPLAPRLRLQAQTDRSTGKPVRAAIASPTGWPPSTGRRRSRASQASALLPVRFPKVIAVMYALISACSAGLHAVANVRSAARVHLALLARDVLGVQDGDLLTRAVSA